LLTSFRILPHFDLNDCQQKAVPLKNSLKRQFICFLVLAGIVALICSNANAGEGRANGQKMSAAVALWQARPGGECVLDLGETIPAEKLGRIRGKGFGQWGGEHASTTACSGRIILWDENGSPRTKSFQNNSLGSGLTGKQTNQLIINNQ
jgi:hypothetical protein